MSLKAGGRIAEVSCVAELVKSFGFPSLSKVLTTSATELKFVNAKRPCSDAKELATRRSVGQFSASDGRSTTVGFRVDSIINSDNMPIKIQEQPDLRVVAGKRSIADRNLSGLCV